MLYELIILVAKNLKVFRNKNKIKSFSQQEQI